MNATLTIALAQVEGSADPEKNLQKAETVAMAASKEGANLLVFPEMFMAVPAKGRPPAMYVQPDDNTFLETLKEIAQSAGLFITAGCWEASPENGRVYNTAYTVSPRKQIAAAYRKLHLFDALSVRESDTMVPGRTLPAVIEINGIRTGFAICYDLRFPEIFRYLADKGAELIVVPSAWYQGPMKEDHWLTLLRARAIENTLYVAGCNLIGPLFCGRSALFDPFGVPVTDAGENDTLIFGNIAAERVQAVRRKLPSLNHRRRDLFS